MATPEQVAELRPMIADAEQPYTYTPTDLGALIDAQGGNLRKAAALMWQRKAGEASMLVDTTEGSSSRKLGSLYKNALEMAAYYSSDTSTPGGGSTGRTRTRPIVRL